MRHHPAIFAALFTLIFTLQTLNAQDKPKGNDKPMMDTKKDRDQKEIVVIETTMGTIEVAMFRTEAPKTVENFVQLAQKGYYNGIIFHRVIDKFMIQGGDPTGTGTAGESIYGAKFADEISPKLTFDRPGLLAMANAGPNTNGSQFFITTVPTGWLTGRHTIFGEVVSGMDVVNAIGKVQVNKANSKPVKDVVMISVYLKGAKKAAGEQKK
jgi:cyclophilin family peptidyl-prolyl cis-trans isomerase